jgi:hypothetical protein
VEKKTNFSLLESPRFICGVSPRQERPLQAPEAATQRVLIGGDLPAISSRSDRSVTHLITRITSDRIQKARLAELKDKIRIGIEASDRGEVFDIDDVFAELEQDSRLMEAIA